MVESPKKDRRLKILLINAQLYGIFETIIAVLASRQYQYTHSALYGWVKLSLLLRIAHSMVNSPKLNGKTRRILRLISKWALRKSGSGIDMMRRSLDKLNTKFVIR